MFVWGVLVPVTPFLLLPSVWVVGVRSETDPWEADSRSQSQDG